MAKSIKILVRRENLYVGGVEGGKKPLDMAAEGSFQLGRRAFFLQAGALQGAGDMVGDGHLTLGLGHAAVQTVAAGGCRPPGASAAPTPDGEQAVLLCPSSWSSMVLLTHHVTEAGRRRPPVSRAC